MSVQVASAVLAQLAVLAFVAGGFALILAGGFQSGRTWAGRLLLLGVVLAVVAGLVTPEWLP
jgi:uncharacterized membrane protein